MSRKNLLAAMMIVPAVSLLLMSGCSKKESDEKIAEKMMEKVLSASSGKDVNVDVEDGKVKIESSDSKTEIAETGTWPKEMFTDVPQFTSGRIEHVVKSLEEGGSKKFNIYYADIQPDAVKNYSELLNKGGWQASVMEMGDKGGMLNAQKGNVAINFPYNQEDKSGTLMVYDFKE